MLKAPDSLQGRLLGLVLATATAVWVAAAALTWIDVRHELDELLDGHLAQSAALLVAQQGHPDDDEQVDAPVLHRYAPRVTFQVFHEGRLAMRSGNAPAAPLVAQDGLSARGFHTVVLDGERWRVFAAQGMEHDVQVFVGERESARASILRAVLRSTLWPELVGLPLLALAACWAVRRGLTPLRWLAGTLDSRDPGALQPLAQAGAPSEVRTLLQALNALFARIGSLLERERRFTGDAAHELRTPVAAVRAQAQVALAAEDDAQRRRALQATLAGCDRATRVLEQLLTLSRLESGAAATLVPVDVAQVVRAAVAELAPASLARQQVLELEAEPASRILGDETLLGVLARNAVDNAIRYSPAGARIAVTVERSGREVLLRVEDSGPGLAEAGMQRLGERFFRGTGQEASGTGLGWSIMQRIVVAHGGSLRPARSASLGGLAVHATFASSPAWPLRRPGKGKPRPPLARIRAPASTATLTP